MKPAGAGGAGYWAAWIVAGLIAVLLLPSLVRPGEPFWDRAPAELPQHLAMAAAFLLYALSLRLAAERPRGLGVATAAVAAAACFGLAYLFLISRPDLPHSRAVVLVSAVLAISLALLPYLGSRLRVAGTALLALGTIGLIAAAPGASASDDAEAPAVTGLETALARVTLRLQREVVPPPDVTGGALAVLGEGFLLVTGSGDFYRLAWAGDSLQATPLPSTVPFDRERFLADHEDRPAVPRLGVTGMALDTLATPQRALVAYQHWNGDAHCFTLRVSAAPLAELTGAAPVTWTPVFESQPCLPSTPPYSEWETGGRLAWDAHGELLLTVGNHGFDRTAETTLAQLRDNDYGKVLRLDGEGGREIVSMGHRNPQGLAVAADGRIWLSEHGPRGGDELNLIVPGANYGWPYATYGTDYGTFEWPLGDGARDHGDFTEPAYVFVPSPGISDLIQVRGAAFPTWAGDLLVASLGERALYRARLRDDRVMYVEPMAVGQRIRDVEEARDGRIVLWVDSGSVVVVSPAEPLPAGEMAFQRCADCHRGEDESIAPSLRGIVGAPVARSETYSYSDALRRLGGRWTPERLDAFLADPTGFAPGTYMRFWGADSTERAAVIAYLDSYR